ncbi:hypothetical protein GCM10027578_14700 [Spirosoma luteolum]
MKTPFFQPWVGENYSTQSPKILVLGESHYGKDEWYTPEFTQGVIKDWALCQKGTRSFFTKIAKILLGKPHEWISLEEKHDLWHRVAFYNYVQEFVGVGPRMRPTPAMWTDAEDAFEYVMKQLTPDIVIVMGKELGWHVRTFEKNYPGTANFCYWTHPSARSFKKDEAVDAFAKALNPNAN